MKVYLANSLFSEADRMYNDHLASTIRRLFDDIEVFLPQESMEINDKNSFADSKMIAEFDTKELLSSDVLIAVLDGAEIDSGVSTEIGIFSTTGKPIVGLYTDIRQYGADNQEKIDALIKDSTENQFMYRNLFTVGVIKKSNGCIAKNIYQLLSVINNIRYTHVVNKELQK